MISLLRPLYPFVRRHSASLLEIFFPLPQYLSRDKVILNFEMYTVSFLSPRDLYIYRQS